MSRREKLFSDSARGSFPSCEHVIRAIMTSQRGCVVPMKTTILSRFLGLFFRHGGDIFYKINPDKS